MRSALTAGQSSVVAVIGELTADSFPALSIALTWYRCELVLAKPVSVADVAGACTL